MTIDYRILIGKSLNKMEKERVDTIIKSTFNEVDSLYNKWNPRSEVSLLNDLPAGTSHPLSDKLYQFLIKTDEYVKITEGRFDPTIEPLQALWKKKLDHNEVPTAEELADIKSVIGWHHIHFDKEQFHKDDRRVKLDLGGIAKGYCVDLLVQRLNDAGFPDVFVEWGGEIAASGHHPEGRPWQIYISQFENSDPDKAMAIVPLQDQAIATSGNYLQTWKLPDGTIYSHVFDPRTLHPIRVTPESIASASVLAQDCTTADALATALMLFDNVDEAREWLKNKDTSWKYWILTRETKN